MSDWRIKLYRGVYAAVRSRGGRTERVSLRTTDLEAAKRALADWLAQPTGPLVGDIVRAYLVEKDKTAIRAADLHLSWRNAEPHFGHLRPDQITRQVCRAYAERRYAQGRKPATVRKELECVRAALNFNKTADKAVFELPAAPPHKDRFLTKEEARRLSRAARQFPHIRAFIVLSLCTAARSSALLELTWDRVDFEHRRINLMLRDGLDSRRKARARVPINRRAYRYLKVLYRARTCDYVIEWGGHHVKSVKKGFAAACAKAGLEDVTPHTLRHTAASWMAMARVPMHEISKMLGHTNTKVTERVYIHLSPDFLAGATKVLEF